MKILFGQAYHLRFDPKLWADMRPYPPLGSLLAAAVARDAGHEVEFYDSMLAGSVAEWEAAVEQAQPDLVVLYEDNFNYLTKMCLLNMREAAVQMLVAARAQGAVTAICGSDASDQPEYYLDQGADYVLLGEGEGTLSDLLELLREGRQAPDLAGLALRDRDRAVINPRRQVLRHLDELPLPAWDLVDLDRYRRIWLERHGYFSINLATTRGCPYHCNWCAKPIWGQRYHSRSPAKVVEEIAWLNTLIGVDHVWFADDIFGLKPRWVEGFAAALADAGLTIRFKALSRADLILRPDEVKHLRNSGCETLWMGAESGSQTILDAMEKGTTVQQITDARARLGEAGIRVGYFIQFGYPGEGWPEIRETLDLISRSVPDEMGISVSYPLPGTRFHEQVREQLQERRHWVDSNDLAMLYAGPFSTPFYRRLYAAAHHRLAAAQHRRAARSNLPRLAWHGALAAANTALLYAFQFFKHRQHVTITPDLSRLESSKPTPQEYARE